MEKNLLEIYINKRNDIIVSERDGVIRWTSGMAAGAYYPLVGMHINEASKIVKLVRIKSGYGFLDSVELLEDSNWNVVEAITSVDTSHKWKI